MREAHVVLPLSDTGGSGIPLVLLHGMSGDRTLWEPFVPPLAARFRLIAVDLPGHGDAVGLEPGLLPQLRGLRDIIEALDLGPLGLVGHSMGTLPAMLFRSSTHDVVGSIAVEPSLDLAGFAATFGADDGVPEDEAAFSAWARESWRHAGIDCVPEPTRQFVTARMHPRRNVALASWQGALTDDVRAAQVAMDAALAAVRRPTLILYGSEPSPAERRAASLMPGATVEVWNGTGHWLHYVDIDRFAERVVEFFGSIEHQAPRNP